jgi:hypothetical protein
LLHLRLTLKIILIAFIGCCCAIHANAQFFVTGTVYDSSKINLVEGVKVVSTSGVFAMTDSLGRYSIRVNETDSISFVFRNKPTQKFDVASMSDPSRFNISLHITVKGKYSTLSEVIVRTKSYREDSLENRKDYADIFAYKKPGFHTDISPSGVVGADLDELINIFRFKRNKQLKAFQRRLEFQEQEKYITYRFNKTVVKRITGLDGEQLDAFIIKYRPTYELVSNADEVAMNQYILKCFYQFKIEVLQEGTGK